jgi:predicted nucleic acid-binding protein
VVVLPELYGSRVLPVTAQIAEEWGRMDAVRSLPVIDTLLAATAKVHGLIVVTRNTAHFAGLGVEVFNPFEP